MIEYHRGKDKRPVGVLVAEVVDGDVRYGYSLCHRTDVFSKSKGRMIASNRAEFYKPEDIVKKVPHTLRRHLVEFSHRAKNYYQDKVVPLVVEEIAFDKDGDHASSLVVVNA